MSKLWIKTAGLYEAQRQHDTGACVGPFPEATGLISIATYSMPQLWRTLEPDEAGTAQSSREVAAKETMTDDDQCGSQTLVLSVQWVSCVIVCCLLFRHQVFCLSGGRQRLNMSMRRWRQDDEVEERKSIMFPCEITVVALLLLAAQLYYSYLSSYQRLRGGRKTRWKRPSD